MVKILFFGTPEIAVPFLERLAGTHEVVGAVTQPDRPADRGQQMRHPPVKEAALRRGIPVFQPEKFTDDVIASFRALGADVGVVVAYGKLIPSPVITLPGHRCFNIHFSLLPKYRGAAPVQRALMNGERETGVTTFWLEKTLDTGPVIVQKTVPVAPEDDAPLLFDKLIALGLPAMDETLSLVASGKAEGHAQEGEASYAPSLTRDEGRIDWTKSADDIVNLIRGTCPWPGAFTVAGEGKLAGKRIKILKAQALSSEEHASDPGRISGTVSGRGFVVACGRNKLLIEEVHPENRKPMPAWSFWQGGYLHVNDKLL